MLPPFFSCIASLLLLSGLISAQLPPTQSNTGAATNSTDAGRNQTSAPSATATQAPSNTNVKDAVIMPPDGVTKGGEADIQGDPLLNPLPLPKGRVTLIGGSVNKVDPIRERLTLEPFGSHEKMNVSFDDRTHIYRDGRETTYASIKRGDRVYADTMLDGSRVFARNIRVVTQLAAADASGQVIAYNPDTWMMTLRDQISTSPVSFTVGPDTAVKLRDGRAGTRADLKPESLVSVQFSPGRRRGTAKQVQVIALPGESFTFAGKITNVDLRTGMIAVNNTTDDKIYDISVDPGKRDKDLLKIGKSVTVRTTFTGKGYQAESVEAEQ
jgi:hypothetical protein